MRWWSITWCGFNGAGKETYTRVKRDLQYCAGFWEFLTSDNFSYLAMTYDNFLCRWWRIWIVFFLALNFLYRWWSISWMRGAIETCRVRWDANIWHGTRKCIHTCTHTRTLTHIHEQHSTRICIHCLSLKRALSHPLPFSLSLSLLHTLSLTWAAQHTYMYTHTHTHTHSHARTHTMSGISAVRAYSFTQSGCQWTFQRAAVVATIRLQYGDQG